MAKAIPSLKLPTGATFPQLGFGTWRLTEKADDAVYNAIKLGYRHIDCATAYDNQDQVGKGFARAFKDGLVKREELFVTSKLWNKEHGEVEAALKRVLKDLQLEYLDLYLVHWPINMLQKSGDTVQPPMSQTWKQMEEQVDEGLTRAIGISNHSIKKTEQLLDKARIKPAVQQIEAHPYFRNDELIEAMKAHDIVVTAYSPLGSKTAEGQTSPLDDDTVKEIAEAHSKEPAQVLLRWGLQRGYAIIPKATTEEHIKSNLEIFDFELTEEEMKKLSDLKPQRRSVSASMFTQEEGPYKTEEDVWDKGFPGDSV